MYNSDINKHELRGLARGKGYGLHRTRAGDPIYRSMESHHSCWMKTFHGGCYQGQSHSCQSLLSNCSVSKANKLWFSRENFILSPGP